MKKNLSWLKVFTVFAMLALLAAACAPGDLERIPVPGQEQSSGAEQPPSAQAGADGYPGANLELPPTQPICPTPTPTVGVGTTGGGETGVGEAVAGPASSPEPVLGGQSGGYPVPNVLDQVNQSPGVGRSDQTSGESGVGPEPGTESQPGDLGGASVGSGTAEPGIGDLLGAVIGQVLGTSEPGGVSFEPPPPSPTPCP